MQRVHEWLSPNMVERHPAEQLHKMGVRLFVNPRALDTSHRLCRGISIRVSVHTDLPRDHRLDRKCPFLQIWDAGQMHATECTFEAASRMQGDPRMYTE